jgi:hypothetical protein
VRCFKNKKSKGRKLLAGVIFTLALIMAFSWEALASYIHNETMNSYLSTARENFYFTSNLLTDKMPIPAYQITHDWQTEPTATVSFELRNYETPLNVSDMDITYTVETDAGGDTFSGSVAHLGGEGNKETINLNFTNPNPETPLEVTVTVTATSPYVKVLRGKFVIAPAIAYYMDENEGKPVAVLTIELAYSSDLAKDLTISWPEGATPDMTDRIVMSAVNEHTIDLEERTLTASFNTGAVYELVFFKDSTDNYSEVVVTSS